MGKLACHTKSVARSVSFPLPCKWQSLRFPLPCGGGLRGWVDSTSASQAKLATANDKNATASNANFASISKADSALSAKSAKDTHHQTPSAREGASAHARNDKKYCHT